MPPLKTALFLAAIATSILALDACRKLTGETVIEGTVIDAVSGEPVPNILVFASNPGATVPYPAPGDNSPGVASTTSDAQGRFYLEFDDGAGGSRGFEVYAHREESYHLTECKAGYGKRTRATRDAVVKPWPYGLCRIRVTNPLGGRSIGIGGLADYGGGLDVYGHVGQPNTLDTTILGRVLAGKSSHVISFMRHGDTTAYRFPATIGSLDTVDYHFTF